MNVRVEESPPKTISEVCGKKPDAFTRFVNTIKCEICSAEYDKSKEGGNRRGFNMCKTCIGKFTKMPVEEFNFFLKKSVDLDGR